MINFIPVAMIYTGYTVEVWEWMGNGIHVRLILQQRFDLSINQLCLNIAPLDL